MARYKEVCKSEKYMDDAIDTILSNIWNGVKRRKQLSIWDPIENFVETVSFGSDPSERSKILTKILSSDQDSSFAQNTPRSREENKLSSGTAEKRNVFDNRRPPKSLYTMEQRSHQNNLEDERKYRSSINQHYFDFQHSTNRASELSHRKEQIKYPNHSNPDVQNSASKTFEETPCFIPKEKGNSHVVKNSDIKRNVLGMKSETLDVLTNQIDQRNYLTTRCKKKQEVFKKKTLNYQLSRQETKAITELKVIEQRAKNPAPVLKNQIIDRAKKKSNSDVDLSFIENEKLNYAKKYSESRTVVHNCDIENRKTNAKNYSKDKNEGNFALTLACIKLGDENYDASYELFVDVSELSRIKRKFPKLTGILPDIDTEIMTVPYCFEAVTYILKYLFYGRSNLTGLPHATVAVEVLAATKTWEIKNLYSIFYDIFIREILPSTNLKFIFSQASHHNLHEVCSVCNEMNSNSASFNISTYKRKQKMCSISVTTYIEPLEFCLPLNTEADNNIEISFDRDIQNIIKFESLSGFFTIIGVQIQLNSHHLENFNDNSMLNISYEVENETGNFEKPFRQIIVIHFKNPLKVNPKQKVKLTVEITELKPLLCFTYPGEINVGEINQDGEFQVNVVSNCKVPNSNKSVFMVGKLLYNVNKQQKF